MNKEELRKGMLLREKSGEDGKIYRLLALKEKVLVIDCVKKTMPVWKTYEELSHYVEKEDVKAETIDLMEEMEGAARKIAYHSYILW